MCINWIKWAANRHMLCNLAKQWNPEVEHPKPQNFSVTGCFLLIPSACSECGWGFSWFFSHLPLFQVTITQVMHQPHCLALNRTIKILCLLFLLYLYYVIYIIMDWEKQCYNGEVSLKNPPPVICARGSKRVLSCFLHILVCHCQALPFCTEGICVENIEQKWNQPGIHSCWSCDKEFENLEQLLLLPNQLSKEPLQGRVWMGRKWLLRAENKLNSEIFTWNSILKMHWKGLFFFKH